MKWEFRILGDPVRIGLELERIGLDWIGEVCKLQIRPIFISRDQVLVLNLLKTRWFDNIMLSLGSGLNVLRYSFGRFWFIEYDFQMIWGGEDGFCVVWMIFNRMIFEMLDNFRRPQPTNNKYIYSVITLIWLCTHKQCHCCYKRAKMALNMNSNCAEIKPYIKNRTNALSNMNQWSFAFLEIKLRISIFSHISSLTNFRPYIYYFSLSFPLDIYI